jgi:hypothetical protein
MSKPRTRISSSLKNLKKANETVSPETDEFSDTETEVLPLDPTIAPLINDLRSHLKIMKQVNEQIREFKKSKKVDDMAGKIKSLKANLYLYMNDNGLHEVDGYSINFVMPPEVRKERLLNKKRETFQRIMKSKLPTIPEETLDEVIEDIVTDGKR